MATVFLTRKGYEQLSAELHDLVNVRRPQVKSDLVTAREFGDLRENAEYETAKRDQGMIEGRIHELEGLLASVEVIEALTEVTEVCLGARVKIRNLDFDQLREYMLVTEQEAHLEDEYLSVQSPLGKSLLGHKVGDTVIFDAPAGKRKFLILELCGSNGHDKV